MVAEEVERLNSTLVRGTAEVNEKLVELGTAPLKQGATLAELLRRPEITYEDLAHFNILPDLPRAVREQVEIQVKYQGYLNRQEAAIERFERMENKLIPDNLDYSRVKGLSKEAVDRLSAVRPISVGQASRVSGVTPADISVLLIFLEQERRRADV
jgi:tRNA uridine 5-carboxymethylaminomethyl modification enzyme